MKRLLAFVVLILASAAAPLRADDIQIFGGSLDVNAHIGSGKLALFGDRGFTFQANVAVGAGIFRPGDCNGGPLVCTPGMVVALDATWSGLDLAGPATLDGNTYKVDGVGDNSMSVLFSGSVVMPAFTNASTTVSVPFTLSGTFRHTGDSETLHGTGTATLFLSPHPIAPGAWQVDRVLYRLALTCGPECSPPWQVVGVGDFNGDGHADVLWFNANTGQLGAWLLDGQGNVTAPQFLSQTCGAGCSPPWQIVGVGDFNGDGHADALWFDTSTGVLGAWLLDGLGNLLAPQFLSLTCGSGCFPEWQVVGVGDFNGDGHADVLWFDASTGVLGAWLLDGLGNVMAPQFLSLTCGSGCFPTWKVVGVGDFNGDGHADVLWFNADTGELVEWLLDGQGNVMATSTLSRPCGF